MPTLHSRPSGQPAVGTLLVLTDELAKTEVTIAPTRGAIVTSFIVQERELLYLEPATLADATKNVRGGIPVLFPSPGKLTGDAFARDGKVGSMKQHGFARNLPWMPSRSEDNRAEVTLTLTSNALTRSQYPFEFVAELTFALCGSRLSIAHRIQNKGSTPLPFALGYHPYFVVRNKAAARIDTAATRAYDNVTKTHVPFSGFLPTQGAAGSARFDSSLARPRARFDLTGPEVDVYLLDHGSSRSALHLGDGSRIEVRGSAEFTRFVVWTVAGKDYVCLEPWSAALDALNTGEGLTELAPGAEQQGQIELELL